MDGKLIHVSGHLQYLFPSDGGHITVENVSYVQGINTKLGCRMLHISSAFKSTTKVLISRHNQTIVSSGIIPANSLDNVRLQQETTLAVLLLCISELLPHYFSPPCSL